MQFTFTGGTPTVYVGIETEDGSLLAVPGQSYTFDSAPDGWFVSTKATTAPSPEAPETAPEASPEPSDETQDPTPTK